MQKMLAILRYLQNKQTENTMIVIKTATSFILSLILGMITIPFILKFCKERNLYDLPDLRKRHKQAIPRLGGISFLPCMMLSFGMELILFSIRYPSEESIHIWYLYLLFGLIIIYIVGIFDDIIGLKANLKFIVQFVAACCLPFAGIYIDSLFGLFGITTIPSFVGIPLTIFAIMLIVNAVNLIDGIDGLSASISIIALSGFILLYSKLNAWAICIMISGLIGCLVAFLYFNLFGSPKKNTKIFMGDSGSLTLGYILAALFVKFLMISSSNQETNTNEVVLAYSLLIIPVFDVFRVVIIRLHNRKAIFTADRNHIHHKLMGAGCSQHKALGIIIALSFVFILGNMALSHYCCNTVVFVVDILAYIIFNFSIKIKNKT